MATTSTFTQAPKDGTSRSLGIKFIIILVLIVLMAIPIMFISIMSFERSSRASEVTQEVSQIYGGEQRLLGPILIIPYRETLANGELRDGDYIVSATTGEAVFDNIVVEEKSRSLYKVPIYQAEGTLSAQFPNLAVISDQADVDLDFDAARIVIGLGDVTGLQADVTLRVGEMTQSFDPYASHSGFGDVTRLENRSAVQTAPEGRFVAPNIVTDRFSKGDMTWLSVPATALLGQDAQAQNVSVIAEISFTGASRLSITPYAKTTSLQINANWPHPGFSGKFPPSDRSITENGFAAEWVVPYLRRGLSAQGRASDMAGLTGGLVGAMEVSFVNPFTPYQTVNRALKYAVLFIGLVFLAYFLMETLLNVRVHPAQYLLIGIAQAVFYLLLLAFAEHLGFAVAFALSAVATVGLTAGYAGAVFGRSLMGVCVLVFGAVYALLFVLMRIQDFALMVGALISFIAIAATLYLTRTLDWYGGEQRQSSD